MNWERVYKCGHEWSDYFHSGQCGTPYCSWRESHCRKCGVYEVRCGCGYERSLSGEPRHKTLRRAKKSAPVSE
jgi:hypothetical protein